MLEYIKPKYKMHNKIMFSNYKVCEIIIFINNVFWFIFIYTDTNLFTVKAEFYITKWNIVVIYYEFHDLRKDYFKNAHINLKIYYKFKNLYDM